ncbi:hypothetical protein T484DRAFT_1771123 [Baffinella frigidus]|nr:hypothetical protein T484DRAFT_1771123 [Cryptophyta sp. CCMP2293]
MPCEFLDCQVVPIVNKGQLKEAFNIRLEELQGQLRKTFNIRLEELQVIDWTFLHGCENPTILLLYQDPKEMRHLKTYEVSIKEKDLLPGPCNQPGVSIKEKDLLPGPWNQPGVEMGASKIIPVALPFVRKTESKTIHMNFTDICAWGKVDEDGSRYLLGDHMGKLFVLVLENDGSKWNLLGDHMGKLFLVLENDGSKVLGLKLDLLGETSCASTISYLDSVNPTP